MALDRRVFSVSQINNYIKSLMDSDFILNSLWVKGEISNFKLHSSGHMYFTLKDDASAISCVMFRGSAELLPFMPENGMQVVICGYVSVYQRTGEYQIYAELMLPEGAGALSTAFEQLKKKLSQEGYFDPDFKREIPQRPKKIAVITSPTGAAVRDIIKISTRRNPNINLVVVPVQVQGTGAAEEIVQAIQMVNDWNGADVIIIGRGGGSIEDLWAFNEEKVARAIFASNIPVISAVGHETDMTISDMVADLRAPTPSAAAELAVEDVSVEKERFLTFVKRLREAEDFIISNASQRLKQSLDRPVLRRPVEKILQSQIYIENCEQSLKKEMEYQLEKRKNCFVQQIKKLEVLSPLSVMQRGFVLIESKAGRILSSVDDMEKGQSVHIRLRDGQAWAVIESREKDEC
ncbi:MAG: exodeoxyribonuclease VII large subunit [Clostridiales bacterium]|nr:exodeoxyribonuclease VII large subunit [Clostridiales bacterium]